MVCIRNKISKIQCIIYLLLSTFCSGQVDLKLDSFNLVVNQCSQIFHNEVVDFSFLDSVLSKNKVVVLGEQTHYGYFSYVLKMNLIVPNPKNPTV